MLTIATANASFESLVTNSSKHTERAYRSDMEAYRVWAKAESIPDALYDLLKLGRIEARKKVETYGRFVGKRLARNTTHRRLNSLKSFVTHARRDGIVDWKLEALPPKARTEEAKKATAKRDMSGPTHTAFLKLMKTLGKEIRASSTQATALRDRAIIGLLQNPMLRRGETAALNIGDIHLGREPFVRTVGKKKEEPDDLPLPPGVASYLEAWIELRGGKRGDPLFVRIRNQFGSGNITITNERLSDSGIYKITTTRGWKTLGKKSKRLNPHALRHAGITRLATYCSENGIPIIEGMKVSRHKKSETFWGYYDRTGNTSRKLVNGIERQSKA